MKLISLYFDKSPINVYVPTPLRDSSSNTSKLLEFSKLNSLIWTPIKLENIVIFSLNDNIYKEI